MYIFNVNMYMGTLGTTFDYDNLKAYKEGLTSAKPEDGGLWFRVPKSLKTCLTPQKVKNLEGKIRNALSSENSRDVIKDIFSELWMSLKVGFTKNQLDSIVSCLDKFDDDLIVPIEHLHDETYLLNESYGPTDAFKDLALQMLTSMVGIIVSEENRVAIEKAKNGEQGQKLKFLVNLTSTSGDTGPAGGAGIKGKNFIVNVIGFPGKESTFSQIGQMVTIGDNVLAIPMEESFSDIQAAMIGGNTKEYQQQLSEIIKEELSDIIDDYGFKVEVLSGSFNSINPGRIDGQTIYHTYGLLQAKAKGIIEEGEQIIEVIPSGNGGHVYSVLQARLMGKVDGPTIITCNSNDMFYKIFEEGRFQKTKGWEHQASVSMIIEYPNNMIRLFSYAFGPERAKQISDDFFAEKEVVFTNNERKILKEKIQIHCYRVDSEEELQTIRKIFDKTFRLVCPHTGNAIAGLKKYREETGDTETKALVSETASPWKFLAASAAALTYKPDFEVTAVSLYEKYRALEREQKRCMILINKIKKVYKSYGQTFDEKVIPKDLRDIYKNGYGSRDLKSAKDFHTETLKFVKRYAPKLKKQVKEWLK